MPEQQMRKVTVMLPNDLVERAVKATGVGLTPTIRKGLEAMAASEAFETILAMKGKARFPKNFLKDLRRD
jgi:hypothetical protein